MPPYDAQISEEGVLHLIAYIKAWTRRHLAGTEETRQKK